MAGFRVGIMLELRWPFRRHLDVFAGAQRYAQETGDWVSEVDEYHATGFARSNYDGILGRAKLELVRQCAKSGVPLVNVWFNSPACDELPGVFPDFAQIGTEAATHLLDRGFRQFGCLAVPREPADRLMIDAFHAGIRAGGFRCDCCRTRRHYHRSAGSWSRFQEKLDDWIGSWKTPIGVFVAFNDVTIRYLVGACRRHGLRIPEDVALISSTNEPLICRMPQPALTSVEVSYEQIGYQAARMLDRLMRGEMVRERILVKPSGVIARDSTDFFAAEDDVVYRAMRFIEQHSSEEINVDTIAVAVNVSRRTLERRFRENAGRSVAAELRRIRLIKAKRLLAETNLLVKQIAGETGFRDAVRLSEALVRDEGVNPTDYRRAARGQ